LRRTASPEADRAVDRAPSTTDALVPAVQTVYLISPANCSGLRAQTLMRRGAAFPLALRLRTSGAPLGEVFSFMSGLYFRGKLAYARTFAAATRAPHGVLVITPGRGLVSPDENVTIQDLRAMANVSISLDVLRFREPFERDVEALAALLSAHDRVVLLGSIATDKYVDVLERRLQGRLCFPVDFVGRGDMSRGGLMLRRVRENRPLSYVPIAGARRHGPRPPKLGPLGPVT
jgi:hypothetical protein